MTAQDLPTKKQREPFPLRLIDAVTQGLNVLGTLLILALMVLIGIDVAGRDLFGKPLPGVPEIVTLSIVAIVFLQIPQVLKEDRLTRTEALGAVVNALSPRFGRFLDTVFDLIGIAVVGVIVWATWPLFVRSWTQSDFIGAIGQFTAPTWPVKATVLVGGTMLILQFLIRIFRRHARPS